MTEQDDRGTQLLQTFFNAVDALTWIAGGEYVDAESAPQLTADLAALAVKHRAAQEAGAALLSHLQGPRP